MPSCSPHRKEKFSSPMRRHAAGYNNSSVDLLEPGCCQAKSVAGFGLIPPKAAENQPWRDIKMPDWF